MEQEEGDNHPEHSSPSNTSSQGDMADTEMEAGPSRPSETAITPPPPPKKKRTRTLTTPHQSAVLHALLAQVINIVLTPNDCLLICYHSSSPVFLQLPCVKKLVGLSGSVHVKFRYVFVARTSYAPLIVWLSPRYGFRQVTS